MTMLRKIAVMLMTVLLVQAFMTYQARAAVEYYAGSKTLAAISKAYLDEAFDDISNNDADALQDLLDGKKIILLPSGMRLFIAGKAPSVYSVFSGDDIKVRPKGWSDVVLWVHYTSLVIR